MKLKPYATFVLTLISIVGSLVLAFTKDTDVTMLLPTLLGIYVSAKAGLVTLSDMKAINNTSKNFILNPLVEQIR